MHCVLPVNLQTSALIISFSKPRSSIREDGEVCVCVGVKMIKLDPLSIHTHTETDRRAKEISLFPLNKSFSFRMLNVWSKAFLFCVSQGAQCLGLHNTCVCVCV